ncbi:MAG: hypothetical protein WCK27_24805, partial [Verrucomicrobiota bacterium]
HPLALTAPKRTSADILVRLCVRVNPQAYRRTRMSALQKNVRCATSKTNYVALGVGVWHKTGPILI